MLKFFEKNENDANKAKMEAGAEDDRHPLVYFVRP